MTTKEVKKILLFKVLGLFLLIPAFLIFLIGILVIKFMELLTKRAESTDQKIKAIFFAPFILACTLISPGDSM